MELNMRAAHMVFCLSVSGCSSCNQIKLSWREVTDSVGCLWLLCPQI